MHKYYYRCEPIEELPHFPLMWNLELVLTRSHKPKNEKAFPPAILYQFDRETDAVKWVKELNEARDTLYELTLREILRNYKEAKCAC